MYRFLNSWCNVATEIMSKQTRVQLIFARGFQWKVKIRLMSVPLISFFLFSLQ